MTSVETRLTEALHDAGSVRVGEFDFERLARARQRQVRRRFLGAGTTVLAVAALGLWLASGRSSDTGKAGLIPAASPSAAPQVESIAKPIVGAGLGLELDPAGPPPVSTASYQRLVSGDEGQALSGSVRVVYGKVRYTGQAGGGSLVLSPNAVPDLANRLAVWVIHRAPAGTVYTVEDPVTSARLLAWAGGYRVPFSIPMPSAHSTETSGCASSPAVSVRGRLTRSLVSCAGLVDMQPLPTLTIRVGQTIQLSGLGDGYRAPTSSASSVLRLIDSSATTATFRALTPGAATLRVQTQYCLAPDGASGCTAAKVIVTH